MWPREREGHTGGRGGPHKGGGQPAGSLGCSRSHPDEVSQRNAGTELREGVWDANSGQQCRGTGSFITRGRATESRFLFCFASQKAKGARGMLTPLPDPEVQRMWEKEPPPLEWDSGKLCSWVTARVQCRQGGGGTFSDDGGGGCFPQREL